MNKLPLRQVLTKEYTGKVVEQFDLSPEQLHGAVEFLEQQGIANVAGLACCSSEDLTQAFQISSLSLGQKALIRHFTERAKAWVNPVEGPVVEGGTHPPPSEDASSSWDSSSWRSDSRWASNSWEQDSSWNSSTWMPYGKVEQKDSSEASQQMADVEKTRSKKVELVPNKDVLQVAHTASNDVSNQKREPATRGSNWNEMLGDGRAQRKKENQKHPYNGSKDASHQKAETEASRSNWKELLGDSRAQRKSEKIEEKHAGSSRSKEPEGDIRTQRKVVQVVQKVEPTATSQKRDKTKKTQASKEQNIWKGMENRDYKSMLNTTKLLQDERDRKQIRYETIKHNKSGQFYSCLYLGKRGSHYSDWAATKKQAEQQAAFAALVALGQIDRSAVDVSANKVKARVHGLSREEKMKIAEEEALRLFESFPREAQLWLGSKGAKHLLQYKVHLCPSYQKNLKCPRGRYCTFAHGPEELLICSVADRIRAAGKAMEELGADNWIQMYEKHSIDDYASSCANGAPDPLAVADPWASNIREQSSTAVNIAHAPSGGKVQSSETASDPLAVADPWASGSREQKPAVVNIAHAPSRGKVQLYENSSDPFAIADPWASKSHAQNSSAVDVAHAPSRGKGKGKGKLNKSPQEWRQFALEAWGVAIANDSECESTSAVDDPSASSTPNPEVGADPWPSWQELIASAEVVECDSDNDDDSISSEDFTGA